MQQFKANIKSWFFFEFFNPINYLTRCDVLSEKKKLLSFFPFRCCSKKKKIVIRSDHPICLI